MRLLCTLLWLALAAAPLRAWDNGGHEIVCAIAYAHLNPKAKQAVDQLAAQVHSSHGAYDAITIGCWMDDIRDDPSVPNDRKLRTWHYIDIPISDPTEMLDPMPSFDPGAENALHTNVVQALKRALVVLQGGTDPYIKDQSTALAITEHLVGDLHQPLHCATKFFNLSGKKIDDRGGNLEIVSDGPPSDGKFTLHRFWDVAYRASFDAASGRIVIEDFKFDPARLGEYESAQPGLIALETDSLDKNFELWAENSNAVARNLAYAEILSTGNSKQCRLSSAYVVTARNVARARLELAGFRLAAILNATLGAATPVPVPPSYPGWPPSP